MAKIRLQRYLSQAGVAARRKAEQLILDGSVRVNGKVVDVLGAKVDPDRDRVSVDGKAVHPEDLFYVVLNKPKGCITAVSDPQGRRTVMEYLKNVPVSIAPVGRLDYYSEGVLLLTNDGELSAALQSPKSHVEKTYHVKLRGKVRADHIAAMRSGVRLEDGTRTRPAQVEYLRGRSSHEWLAITLTEGKSRQIRRMAEALGYQVLKLQRVAFADITFHGLRLGDARELTQIEVNALRERVGLPTGGRAISRGKWRVKREDTELGRRALERARVGPAEPASARPSRDTSSARKGRGGRTKPSPGQTRAASRSGGRATRGSQASPEAGRKGRSGSGRSSQASPEAGRRGGSKRSGQTRTAPPARNTGSKRSDAGRSSRRNARGAKPPKPSRR